MQNKESYKALTSNCMIEKYVNFIYFCLKIPTPVSI